jgi:BirA family transcriptional regulator, biotin operon repressor / biotin---[acetyl-CoA-carboxylase] ligase
MPFHPLTNVFGKQLIELRTAESTNKTAAEMLQRSELRHGAVILAHEQTAGQGQRGRSWFSHIDDDLTFSIVLFPDDLRAEHQFILSKIAALAVYEVVSSVVKGDVRIKWPNDILVERRKIAGILIQNDVIGEMVSCAVIGIGLNVNSTRFDEGLMATSMELECGYSVDRWKLLEGICERAEAFYDTWRKGDDLAAEFASRLWARGRWAEMILDGVSITARPVDVDQAGRLILEMEDGEVRAFGLDKVRFAGR